VPSLLNGLDSALLPPYCSSCVEPCERCANRPASTGCPTWLFILFSADFDLELVRLTFLLSTFTVRTVGYFYGHNRLCFRPGFSCWALRLKDKNKVNPIFELRENARTFYRISGCKLCAVGGLRSPVYHDSSLR